jgi:hypothetical protein
MRDYHGFWGRRRGEVVDFDKNAGFGPDDTV